MIEQKYIAENLQKTYCPKCGSSLEGAQLIPISEAPVAYVAHAVCPVCKAESMVTITPTGSGSVQVQSDLTGHEFKKFLGAKHVTYDEVLDLHIELKKENIWKLLQKKEKKQEKKQKA
jgi:hypothetical protein